MEDIKFCYEDCKYMVNTEKEQDEIFKSKKTFEPHICSLHRKRLYHKFLNGVNYHPKIMRHEDCEYERDEKDLKHQGEYFTAKKLSGKAWTPPPFEMIKRLKR